MWFSFFTFNLFYFVLFQNHSSLVLFLQFYVFFSFHFFPLKYLFVDVVCMCMCVSSGFCWFNFLYFLGFCFIWNNSRFSIDKYSCIYSLNIKKRISRHVWRHQNTLLHLSLTSSPSLSFYLFIYLSKQNQ